MKRTALALAALVALGAPALSVAKEPTSASIEGPGLDHALVIAGPEDGRPSSFGKLVALAGVPPAMFGHRVPDPMHRVRPQGTLGPRYEVTWYAPGPPDGRIYKLRQDVYPFATPRPLTYMEPGQPFFETFRTHGGWWRGGPALTQALLDAGIPELDHPGGAGIATPALVGVPLGVAAALALGVLGVLTVRRRRKVGTTPAV